VKVVRESVCVESFKTFSLVERLRELNLVVHAYNLRRLRKRERERERERKRDRLRST
jgi:hypothetical protein